MSHWRQNEYDSVSPKAWQKALFYIIIDSCPQAGRYLPRRSLT